jgi:DNA-binding NarL/FixJ family response regulator
MNVTIADDSDLIINRLQEMLCNFDNVNIIDISRNGIDALKALKTLNPDLAIVDLKMPGLNGLEVLKEIRKENKKMKIIILTFYTLDQYKTIAINAGVNYFFSKSDDFEKVSDVVFEMLENKGTNISNYS